LAGCIPQGGENVPRPAEDPAETVRRIQNYLEGLRQHRGCEPGAREAWDRFFESQDTVIFRAVQSHRWSKEDSDDGAQDLWFLLVDRLARLRYDADRGDLNRWINTAVRRRLMDHEKSRKIHRARKLCRGQVNQVAGHEPDPADAVELKDSLEIVQAALEEVRNQVSPRDYKAFMLRHFAGESAQRIAECLGMTRSQVWSSNHKVMRKLRALVIKRLGPAT